MRKKDAELIYAPRPVVFAGLLLSSIAYQHSGEAKPKGAAARETQPKGVDFTPVVVTGEREWRRADGEYSSNYIPFQVGHRTFKVPRNYVVEVLNPKTSYGMIMRVTYPGFRPLSPATRPCLHPTVALSPNAPCFYVDFTLSLHGGNTSLEAFNSLRDLFIKSEPEAGPSGLELYKIGPPSARIDVYRKLQRDNPIAITCISADTSATDLKPPSGGVCKDEFTFDNSTVILYLLPEMRVAVAGSIQDGLRRLVASFESSGDSNGAMSR